MRKKDGLSLPLVGPHNFAVECIIQQLPLSIGQQNSTRPRRVIEKEVIEEIVTGKSWFADETFENSMVGIAYLCHLHGFSAAIHP